MAANGTSAASEWGELSGDFFRQCNWFSRDRYVWSAPAGGGRELARPLVIFRIRQTSPWDLVFEARYAVGEFSFGIEAVDAPLAGLPCFRGWVSAGAEHIGEIALELGKSVMFAIAGAGGGFRINGEKVFPGRAESDVLISAGALGTVARVPGQGYNETWRQQMAALFGGGFWQRGGFCAEVRPEEHGREFAMCVLAALGLYFFRM